MRAAAFLISLIALPLALPAQAQDSDELGNWSLEKLCKKTDKPRHADAVLAEIERRGIFTSVDLALVRSGEIEVGMGEAALRCSWGKPDSVRLTNGWCVFDCVSQENDGIAWQTYRRRIDGQRLMFELQLVTQRVADIDMRPISADESAALANADRRVDPWTTFSGRAIDHLPSGPACGGGSSRVC